MVRTIVSLEEADKRWLDRYSGRHGLSTAEAIRQAIKDFQKRAQGEDYRRALKDTAGLLRGKDDSVPFVRKIRDEWE